MGLDTSTVLDAPRPLGRRMTATLATLAGLAAAAAVCAAGAMAASPARTGQVLSPPTMHETFSPPGPCTGTAGSRTTVQEVACIEDDILASDRQIDRLNRQIFNLLVDSASRRDFIAGHQAWLRYRQAYCLSDSDVFRGGTQADIEDASCADEINTTHVQDLHQFALDLIEN